MENVSAPRNVNTLIVIQKPYYVNHFSSSARFPTVHRQVGSRIQAPNVVECGCNRFQDTQERSASVFRAPVGLAPARV
jgi:hypothetical protein